MHRLQVESVRTSRSKSLVHYVPDLLDLQFLSGSFDQIEDDMGLIGKHQLMNRGFCHVVCFRNGEKNFTKRRPRNDCAGEGTNQYFIRRGSEYEQFVLPKHQYGMSH